MRVTPFKLWLICLLLAFLIVITLLIGLGVGTANVGFREVWAWLRGALDNPAYQAIISRLRFPRLLTAALVGASLSMSGSVFQGVLRNPLAEPFILGVSGGAATGAVLSLLLGIAGLWTTAGMAFLGALGTVLLVLGIASRRGKMETSTLVLTGVMINAFFTSAIMFFISITTDQKLHAIMFWLYGDLAGASLSQALSLIPVVLLSGILLFRMTPHLNLLSAGEQTAAAAGVNVYKTRLFLFIIVSFMCGVTVSFSGLIGFIGLMVPHLVRMAGGGDYRLLLPASGLFGASFLMAADTLARTVISPVQLPVGVITAFLGAPFFLLLLAQRGSRWW